ARHGARSAPIFRGGGVSFGPHNRSYEYSLPKKVRALGLKMALSAKAKAGDLIIIESAHLEAPKTKDALKCLSAIAPKNACIIDAASVNENMKRAIANIHGYDILPTIGANVYDIIRKEKLIITKDALKTLEERLNG
ncbi:MAG: 50S ribosomal protein L4, partial [Alphaproteobacteria bacterium]|nr:50S ribosomal protein L4 [Alphaproteobacteria bacterium]